MKQVDQAEKEPGFYPRLSAHRSTRFMQQYSASLFLDACESRCGSCGRGLSDPPSAPARSSCRRCCDGHQGCHQLDRTAESGEHPKILQEILGHSRIALTLDTYSHVVPHMQREAMQRFGDRFSGSF